MVEYREIMIKELLKLPAAKLKRAVKLKSEIERLEVRLENLLVAATPAPIGKIVRVRRRMTAAVRRKVSLGAKARWARVRTRLN